MKLNKNHLMLYSLGTGKLSKLITVAFILALIDHRATVSAFLPGSVHPSSSPAFRGSTTIDFLKRDELMLHPLPRSGATLNFLSRSGPSTKPTSLFFNPNPFDTSKSFGFFDAAVATVIAVCLFGFRVVDAGEIGIASTLGNLERYDPGVHVVGPFTSVKYLSTKTELLEQSNFVPTKEGLAVELDTAVLIRLDPDQALELYRSVGSDFIQKLVKPEASSSVRGLTSEAEAKALYTADRTELQSRLKNELTGKLGPRGIVVEDVLLKNVVLPEDLSKSIQEKARAEQDSARMEFVLLKETQEAKRKAIEAEGIADFQRIVSKGITPSLLQWKGIEATEKLAKSPNSKVVIVGNSKDSLPIILGSGDKS